MKNRAMSTEEENIFLHLKGVTDPELMVNIIDLGLVYDVRLNQDEKKIEVDLTLTSPGCPMGDMIMEDAKQSLSGHYTDYEIIINLVWEPAWNFEKLTPEGKEALGKR